MTRPVEPVPRSHDPAIRALTREIAGAADPQILRIVATVDAMNSRGSADALIAPLRPRLRQLRPPRQLGFARLLFHPLDPLIVPASDWKPAATAIPRSALLPIAILVRTRMGEDARRIDAAIAGHTTDETHLIAQLGATLWPASATILSECDMPPDWHAAGLPPALYPRFGRCIVALLRQAPAIDALCAATANGLLPPDSDRLRAMLVAIVAAEPAALPMLVALVIARLPATAALIPELTISRDADAMRVALHAATDQLLRHLDEDAGTEVRIAAGTLAEAGVTTGRLIALLRHLDTADMPAEQRARLSALRRRIDEDCRARFATGLREEVLAPLERVGQAQDGAAIDAMERAARGLRVLEIEARAVGGGATYDQLLGRAATAIKSDSMGDRLGLADRVRLVEILAGPEAAMSLLADGIAGTVRRRSP